jgi:plastocyanin
MPRTTTLLILATALALAGCTGGPAEDDDGSGSVTETVSALDNKFEPKQLEVSAGETVEWLNEGSHSHTVEVRLQGESQKRHSQVIAPEEATTYTFEDSGTFDVWCRYHGSADSGMTMTVTVS